MDTEFLLVPQTSMALCIFRLFCRMQICTFGDKTTARHIVNFCFKDFNSELIVKNPLTVFGG